MVRELAQHWRRLRLTHRSARQVLGLMDQRYTNEEMGPMLVLADRTVEDHRAAIIAKSRTSGIAQLIALSRSDST